jgi:hypothetical protein
MHAFVRPLLLAAAVCAACLAATAFFFVDASLNHDVPLAWHLECALVAAALVGLAAASRTTLLELAAAAAAGGLLANSLVGGICGGVADFVRAGGWLYSPGDLALIGGAVGLAFGTAVALAQR